MRFDVYAINDLEKGEFTQPFFVPEGTDVNSIKINFKRLIEKGDSEISYFPERFELWFLTTFESSYKAEYAAGTLCFLCNDNGDSVECSHCIAKGIDYARPEYLKALAEAKKNMENNEKKID